jgi:hypothetical protein
MGKYLCCDKPLSKKWNGYTEKHLDIFYNKKVKAYIPHFLGFNDKDQLIEEIVKSKNSTLAILNIHNNDDFVREVCSEILKGNNFFIYEGKIY